MESPPAVGVADPEAILNDNLDPASEHSPGYPAILRSDSANPSATQLEGLLIQSENSASYDGRSIGVPYDGRALDIVAASLLLFFVLPLMCLFALAVLATSKGPLIFSHPRIGRDGKLFNCLKFRTMVEHAESSMDEVLQNSPESRAEWQALQKLRLDPRITPIGHFMRRYCIDELPQLFNVLAGDMSLVGPRPIVPAERERFGDNFAAYCSVRPGLTGIWQISGRHELSYQQRVELDAEYARSKSLSLDLLILWKTVPIVVLGQNG